MGTLSVKHIIKYPNNYKEQETGHLFRIFSNLWHTSNSLFASKDVNAAGATSSLPSRVVTKESISSCSTDEPSDDVVTLRDKFIRFPAISMELNYKFW